MDETDLGYICAEAREILRGRVFGRFFRLGRTSFAIDFLPHAGVYLFVDFGPRHSSTFLIRRRRKDMERDSYAPDQFMVTLQNELHGREVGTIAYVPGTGMTIEANAAEATGRLKLFIKVAGERPNAGLLDDSDHVIAWARPTSSDQSDDTTLFSSPLVSNQRPEVSPGSTSEHLDAEYQARTAAEKFEELAARARKKIGAEIAKRNKLLANLRSDLERHGDPDSWKRMGDLILANLGQLRREGDTIFVTDFYDPELSQLEIAGEHNLEPTEVANQYFKRYSKARNAQKVVKERLGSVEDELVSLQARRQQIESAIERSDSAALASYLGDRDRPLKNTTSAKKKSEPEGVKGVRRFLSSDGFEIWVGKKAADNDVLTFRLAKSLEYWLHAADYPGSHVIVRNPGRKDVPERTLIEAAELAAFYSDGRSQVKANVRYALRKFVHKPKRSAPGMVSISSFKTIYVEPRITVENLDNKN